MFSGSGNSNNQIVDNDVFGNHWGILVNVGSADATANLIQGNRLHENGRAGIALLGTASGNTVQNNAAAGNGLLNLAPSLRFDLYAAAPAANTWRDNQGSSNFGTSAAPITMISSGGDVPGGRIRVGAN